MSDTEASAAQEPTTPDHRRAMVGGVEYVRLGLSTTSLVLGALEASLPKLPEALYSAEGIIEAAERVIAESEADLPAWGVAVRGAPADARRLLAMPRPRADTEAGAAETRTVTSEFTRVRDEFGEEHPVTRAAALAMAAVFAAAEQRGGGGVSWVTRRLAHTRLDRDAYLHKAPT